MAEEESNLATSPFIPLEPSKRQIRLLHVDPDPADLSAILEIVSLDDEPKYTALSYTWGTEMSTGAGIALNGGARRPITRNLQLALEHLCEGDKPLKIWIDALCINQKDLAEKSHQITLMKDIYSRAESTCIWLGPSADNSDEAMAVIGELYAEKNYLISDHDSLSEDKLEAINALQRRDWWSRIWVLQEVMLSPQPIVRCGNATLPFEAFVHLDDIRRGYVRTERRSLQTNGSRFLIQGNPFRHVLTDYAIDKPKARAGVTPLAEYASFVDQFSATDPRDKIYGLLGVATQADVQFLAPDYSKSVADIYARATARFIIQYQELLWLQINNDHKNPKYSLPSWCPDYSSDPDWPQRGYTPIALNSTDPFRASGSSCWGSTKVFISGIFPTASWSELHLRGLDFDVVEYVGPNPFMAPYTGHVLAERMANIKAVLAKWQRDGFPYSTLGLEQSEAFWRALMWDRDFDGNKVPSDYVRYFEAWLDRGDVDASYAAEKSGADMDEAELRRLFVKPFTDCCISRSHGRSFVVTKNGYIGLAPFKTRAGDKITVLQGGKVPFVLRQRIDAPEQVGDIAAGQAQSAQVRCEFVGEAFVLGIMEGQAVAQAREADVKVFALT
ncbi:unnamed protein product [Discula destructiva]